MKRFVGILCVCVVCLCLLCSCSNPMPEGMDEETVKKAAETTVQQMNDLDYTALRDTMADELAKSLSEEKLADVWEPFAKKAGAFAQIDRIIVQGQGEFAVAVVRASYEKYTIVFTLSYDTQMKLIGLYFKN